MLKDTSKPQN